MRIISLACSHRPGESASRLGRVDLSDRAQKRIETSLLEHGAFVITGFEQAVGGQDQAVLEIEPRVHLFPSGIGNDTQDRSRVAKDTFDRTSSNPASIRSATS